MVKGSKVYSRYKTLGYVSNHIPVSVRYIQCRKENLFVTCIGKSIHTYGCQHLTLLSVSPHLPEDITYMTSDNFMVYTAAGNNIYAWRRGTEMKHIYKGHSCPVHLLLTFGPHLISIDENSSLKVWDIKTEELILEMEYDNLSFQISAIIHPGTYVNKILLGSDQGTLQLWNIRTNTLVYTFKGWGSGVTVLEQAPAIDVVAIGLKNGHIVLHNLKFDETIMDFQQDWGSITSLTFRTDGHPIMISGSPNGHIILWSLDEQKVMSQILNAHWDAVTGLQCLQGEPLMVSSSPDNSLKVWIFDLPDGGARLLRLREGHSLPPTHIRFHGGNGQNILSTGNDCSLRIFNTVTEIFNKSLGKASYNRKASKKKKRYEEDYHQMPPIVKFTSEVTREKEWDNIIAIHLGIPVATTWSYQQLKMGDFKLVHDRFLHNKRTDFTKDKVKGVASSICSTSCGNFVIIGYTTGHCDRFNMQSGLHRCSYGVPTAHNGVVRGITSDGLNQVVITGGSDNQIKWWLFKDHTNSIGVKKSLFSLDLDDAVTFFTDHKESSIFCAALEDFSIVIIDIESKGIIRHFRGHTGRLTDAAFSPDSRWLVTAGMDCVIRTWDVPAGCLIDQFKVDTACTSLSFSPTSEYIATTHINNLGIFLWINKILYTHVSLQPITPSNDLEVSELDATVEEATESTEDTIDDEYGSAEQIEDLITLSLLSNSRWQNLLNIDLIKKRNKPKDPPKAPEAAPFFLPTIPSLTLQFDLSEYKKDDSKSANRDLFFESLTAFGKLVESTLETGDYEKVLSVLKNMGPSAIDYEVNSLVPGENKQALVQFLRLIQYMLETNKDFELAQAYLGLCLKVHGKVLSEDESLCNMITEVQKFQLKSWQSIQDKLFYNLCVINTCKS